MGARGAWDWIKDKYNRVDEALGGGLPGGTAPGTEYIGIGDRLGSVDPSGGSYTPNLGMPSGPGGGFRPGADPIVSSFVATPDPKETGTGDGIGRRVSRWIEPAAMLAGAAASVYGAHKAGQAEDKRLKLDQAALAADQALAGRRLGLDEETMRRQWEDEERERQRRRRAFMNIKARWAERAAAKAQGGAG